VNAQAILVYLLLHLAFTAVLPPRRDANPFLFRLMAQAAAELDRRLNRTGDDNIPKTPRELFARGVFAFCLLLVTGLLVGAAADRLIHHSYYVIIGFMLLTASPLGTLKALRRTADALRDGKVETARLLLRPRLDADVNDTDVFGMCRLSVEWAAASFLRHGTGVLFWALLAGGMGAMFYVVCAATGAWFGKGPFGRAARFMARATGFPPTVVTVLIMSFASAFVAGAQPAAALRAGLRRYDAVWGAMAGALGVTLGGPRRMRNGDIIAYPWIGTKTASARLVWQDVQRAAMVLTVSFLILTGLVAACVIVMQIFSRA
jgi:adenosylcobinamide-phosphate synthase